jgi:AbrB family looped-hinge helix DNA binding protein
MENVIVETAKVLPKGQITLPKDFREILGVKAGDRVVLVSIDGEVIMMNPAIYALKTIQKNMEGKAEAVGIRNEDDVVKLIREIRSGGDI